MATSPDKGFLEQLREMRNTRMQQLRQGGQQAGLLNKQIAAISTLNKTMESVLRAQSSSNATLKNLSTSQTNVSRQTEQMSKSINNLSSSITKSMGSVASAVGKGASGAAGAVGSAGGAVVGAASSVASGVASTLAKILPFAIAGVVGKMMVYDKMDDSVKKDLTDSFGGLVKSIFGDIDTPGLKKVTAPITKEFGIVFGALGDTLEGMTNKFSDLVKKFEGMSDNLNKIMKGMRGGSDSSTSTPGRQMSMAEREIRASGATGGVIMDDVRKVASATKDFISEDTGTALTVASGAVLAGGAYNIAKKSNSLKSADKPSLASSKDVSRMQDRLSTFQKKQAVKKNIKVLLDNKIVQLLKNIGGNTARKVFSLLTKYPRLSIAGALIELGLTYIVLSSVDGLFEEKEITEDERDELKSYFKKQAVTSFTGAAVGGGVGFFFGGPIGAGLGAYGGKEAADFLGSQLIKVPDVLKEPSDRLDFAMQQNVSKLKESKTPGGSGKRGGAMTPSATMSDAQQVNLTRSFIDYIKKTEGFRARPYGDYKQLSIGYGTKANSPDEVIDEKEAEKRMIEKLTGFQKTVLSYNNKYGYNWNQSQIDALTSFTYNTGEGNLKKLLGDGKRSNEEIAVKMKEYNIAGGEVNQGLVKRREVEMSLFAGGANTGSNTVAQASMTNQSSSYNENLARRRQEAKDAEMYEEGNDSFVGPVPPKPEKKKPLSEFAKQFSLKSFTEGFKERTSELENVISSMTTVKELEQSKSEIEKAKSQQGINIIDQSQNTIVSSSPGSSGGITVTPVTSYHASNMNWQFNSMSGGVRA